MHLQTNQFAINYRATESEREKRARVHKRNADKDRTVRKEYAPLRVFSLPNAPTLVQKIGERIDGELGRVDDDCAAIEQKNSRCRCLLLSALVVCA